MIAKISKNLFNLYLFIFLFEQFHPVFDKKE